LVHVELCSRPIETIKKKPHIYNGTFITLWGNWEN
jgi:hypothetical protein